MKGAGSGRLGEHWAGTQDLDANLYSGCCWPWPQDLLSAPFLLAMEEVNRPQPSWLCTGAYGSALPGFCGLNGYTHLLGW